MGSKIQWHINILPTTICDKPFFCNLILLVVQHRQCELWTIEGYSLMRCVDASSTINHVFI
jgi:hypothetical protein